MTASMTMAPTALGGLLALALLGAFWPSGAAAHSCDDPFSTDLIAGRTIDAGDVKACNDDTTLTITYEATYPWCLLETHLHVATIADPPADPDANIPQNRPGNPIPGHFAYGDDYGGCLDGAATFEIPLEQIDGGVGPGEVVVIAAHAEVEDGKREETAWGEGSRFVARGNWAMYFTYDIQEQFLCGDSESKCVFLTSSSHNGNLGGLARGDEICRARAAEAGLPGAESFLAWLSEGSASPSTRFTQATVPYKLVNGTTVAPDWSGLVDGTLDAPINVTERGSVLPANLAAWTGTAASGGTLGPDCDGWSVADPANLGRLGNTTLVDSRWTSGGTFSCNLGVRLFCFQQ
jgi:hypothetical protein